MGEGEETEPKLGTHYWPGNNNALMLAVSDEKIKLLCELVTKIKSEASPRGPESLYVSPGRGMRLTSSFLPDRTLTPFRWMSFRESFS